MPIQYGLCKYLKNRIKTSPTIQRYDYNSISASLWDIFMSNSACATANMIL